MLPVGAGIDPGPIVAHSLRVPSASNVCGCRELYNLAFGFAVSLLHTASAVSAQPTFTATNQSWLTEQDIGDLVNIVSPMC